MPLDKVTTEIACPYCGQHQIIEVKEGMTEAEYQDEAVKKCSCSAAKSEIRKRERKKRINEYIAQRFPENLHDYIRETISLVECYEIDNAKIKDNAGTTHTIKMDKDAYVVISSKKTTGATQRF